MIELSIIVPCYNACRFLRPCIESMRGQLDERTEVICVNDGSDDGTLDVLDELSREIPSLLVVNQEHSGSAAARNNGLHRARGKYIWFVDADDLLKKDAISTIIDTMDANACDSMIFGYEEISARGETVIPYQEKYSTLGIVSGVTAYLKEEITSLPWNRVFRRDFLEKYGMQFRTLRPDDEDFVLRSYAYSQKTLLLNKCLYSFRTVPMSDSRNPGVSLLYLDGYLTIMNDHLAMAKEYGCREFWMKVTFHCYKNMFVRLRDHERNVGEYARKDGLFSEMRDLMKRQLSAYRCNNRFYWLVKAACLCPVVGYKCLCLAFYLKKGE